MNKNQYEQATQAATNRVIQRQVQRAAIHRKHEGIPDITVPLIHGFTILMIVAGLIVFFWFVNFFRVMREEKRRYAMRLAARRATDDKLKKIFGPKGKR